MHCVLTAQAFLHTLRKDLKVLQIREKYTNRANPDSKAAVEATKVAIEAASAAVKLFKKTWPVRFYNIGAFWPCLASSQIDNAQVLF
jgi:hypothetical protein